MRTATLHDLPGVRIGHATDDQGLTGCTVLCFPEGAVASHVVRGTATGSRELAALTPAHRVERVHGVCLAGGSAFGLAAASGVMRRLEAEGIGHPTGFGRVPIVAAAVVYDLNLGDPRARPDEAMGEAAAARALAGAPLRSGNVGAGTGVSAGKLLGPACATKTGLGHGGFASDDGLSAAALVVANPVGDVLDPATGRILAGARTGPDSRRFAGSTALIRAGLHCDPAAPNTVLGVVATTAQLTRLEASWMAEQAAVALARCIDPPFTLHDGDVLFCLSLGFVQAEKHRVAVLCRDAVAAALVDACRSAAPAGGLPCGEGLEQPEG